MKGWKARAKRVMGGDVGTRGGNNENRAGQDAADSPMTGDTLGRFALCQKDGLAHRVWNYQILR